ncbi:MAG: hypothetical protein RLZZ628_305 [Bacteroidota bacterium]|jgi:predicted helicase
MSLAVLDKYYNERSKLSHLARQDSEVVLRRAFARVLETWADKYNLTLVEEVAARTPARNLIRFDGVLKNELGIDFGYWEAKKKSNQLEDEVRLKFNQGYPKTNILFENGKQAILYQEGQHISTIEVENRSALQALLYRFFAYKTRELASFNEAIADFKRNLPTIVATLKQLIQQQSIENEAFIQKRTYFLQVCKQAIRENIDLSEVDEMLIQHILTEQIFKSVLGDEQTIQENNIARTLIAVEATFFTGQLKRNTLNIIKKYYEVVAIEARRCQSVRQKQDFLKKVYENFYKAYNPKGADKLGIVYTPTEIVQFQIKATDYLLETHFGKTLSDKGVQILDPATGTGTYICELIDYMRPQALKHKFKHELHANEIAILPYYIANLNIEYTYQNKMQQYESFDNLCFADTLDNDTALGWKGKQMDMFSLSAENAARIKRQNEAKISVILGNPPYNANQQNENDNNKNRTYPEMDKRIKETFIAKSSAQKTKVYDMYARFFRWAMDRLDENGVIAFITNRSFIDSRTFDGFRACVQQDFDYVYIIDLGGDIRTLSGKDGIFLNERHTIFGKAAAVGIAMIFLVKKQTKIKKKSQIFYIHPCDIRATRDEKLEWLRDNPMESIDFQRIVPDKNNNWINLPEENDWESLIAVYDKNVKSGKSKQAIFSLFSQGVKTNRDEWVYDFDSQMLANKMQYYIDFYEKERWRLKEELQNQDISKIIHYDIKWTRALKGALSKNTQLFFDEKSIKSVLFRPYVSQNLYYGRIFNEDLYQVEQIFKNQNELCICVSGVPAHKTYQTLMVNKLFDYHLLEDTQCLALYNYDKNGNRQDNITDWALAQFQQQYCHSVGNSITKAQIFYYVYAVLHAPAYRAAYEINLKRDFPRIPYYADFQHYAHVGQQLADLHIGYETVAAYPLQRIDKAVRADFVPKAKLKADKTNHCIEIDEITQLCGVPEAAWQYKLGNRSALEWILDQYKPSKPSDPTIAAQFNTYRFADYKEEVIELLGKVCTVSVETAKLINKL